MALYMAAKETRLKSVICQNFADLTSEDTNQLVKHPALTKYLKPILLNLGNVFPSTQIPISIYLDIANIEIKYFGNIKDFLNMDPLVLQSISLKALRSLATTGMSKSMEEITTPVMVFQGTDDNIFPVEHTQKLFDRLNCKKHFEVFEGMNHALMSNNPVEILQPILKWLDEVHQYEHDSARVN